jgi:archaellum component FlaC
MKSPLKLKRLSPSSTPALHKHKQGRIKVMSSDSSNSLGFLHIRNEKAQKLLGWVAVGAVGLGIWNWVLPWVLFTLVGTLKVVAIGSILAIFAMIVLDPRIRWMVGYLTQRFVGLLTSAVINTDPIGVMKARLREMQSTYNEFLERIAELRGSVEKALRDMEVYVGELQDAEGKLTAAQRRNPQPAALINTLANTIQRREKAIDRIKKEIEQGRNMISLLERYAAKSEAYIADTSDNISMIERERKRLKTAFSAFDAAKKILKGQSVGADMYDEALDVASEQASAMVGEMKQFITESRSAIEGFELEQEGAVQTVLARIERKSSQSKMLEYQPGVPMNLQADKEPVPVSAGADINRFLNG